MFFRFAGRLYDFDGICVRTMASLRKLGVTGIPIVEPLGRLVAVHDQRRLVVLDYQGRLVASTTLSRRPKRADCPETPHPALLPQAVSAERLQ